MKLLSFVPPLVLALAPPAAWARTDEGPAPAPVAPTEEARAIEASDPPAGPEGAGSSGAGVIELERVVVRASADASAQGLAPAYPGGQVARGARIGVLGTRRPLETPFSATAFTNELIEDKQAQSVGDVLQNDPSVRVARGFGNFQESYFIRGFILSSDDVAYNGLYSLLPRQFIASELFERVEVLRGASAFLNGANPGGGGLGGAVNLLPKRAAGTPLTRFTLETGSGPQGSLAADVGRRFGPGGAFGLRLNAAIRGGGTSVDGEDARLGVVSLGGDWRGRRARVSADIGYQDHRLDAARPNVQLAPATGVPRAPDGRRSFAQPWSFSDERDVFGTVRGELDVRPGVTAYAAYGLRRSREANSLANLLVTDGATGQGTTSRFDNTREDAVDTGEAGVRGAFATGPLGHEWVIGGAYFRLEAANAFAFDFQALATGLYAPTAYPQPAFTPTGTFFGNRLDDPRPTRRTTLKSVVIGDSVSAFDRRLVVTAGVRYQRFDLEDFAYTTGAPAAPYEQGRTSPSLGVVYRPAKSLGLYANYIEGLTQGATIPGAGATPAVFLDPYVSRQKEVGLKLDTGRLGGGVAVFGTQRPRGVFAGPVDGQDRHRGLEASVYGLPARGLRVLGGLTLLDAEQRGTSDPALDGRRVIGVPRLQGSLGGEYDLALPWADTLTLDARVVYTGARFADEANTQRVGGWTRVDLGTRYTLDLDGHAVTLRARLDNAFDRDHWASVGGFPGIGYLVVGRPRTFLLNASVDY